MRSKTFAIAFTSVFLILVAGGSLGVVLFGYSTYLHYVNPYTYVPTRPASSIAGMGMTPLVKHAVIFILDGVRADIFYRTSKPTIASYVDWANWTDVQCSTLTSVSKVGYSVISSGVNSSESQVINNDYEGLFKGDSLWNATIGHSGTTAAVGTTDWLDLFKPWLNYSIAFTHTSPGEPTTVRNSTNGGAPVETALLNYNDSLVSQYAQKVLKNHKPTLMVVHFSETDAYAHKYGSLSQEYVNSIENEDIYIGQVLSEYQDAGILSSTLVVVMADHGHVDVGGHGGTEPDVLHIPVIIRGPGVKPGEYGTRQHQNSVAPTVAVLMGWEIPSDASGTALFQCLNLTSMQEAIYRINSAEIRLAQTKITLQKTGYLATRQAKVDEATRFLAYAESNFTDGKHPLAIDNAVLSEGVSTSELMLSLSSKASEEATGRLILTAVVIVILAIPVALLFYKWRGKVKATVIGKKAFFAVTVLSAALYFMLLSVTIVLTGWKFSGSYFPESVTAFIVSVFRPTLVALIPVGIAFLALLWYLNRKAHSTHARGVTWSALFLNLIAITYASIIVFFSVRNGLGLAWYASDVSEGLEFFFVGISTLAFGIFALVSFSVGLGLVKVIGMKGEGAKK